MRKLWLKLWIVAGVLALFPAAGSSHRRSPVRRIIAQINPDAIAIMIVYRPGSAQDSQAMALGSAYTGVGVSKKRLKQSMARHALAPMRITLNNQLFRDQDMEIKLVADHHENFSTVILLRGESVSGWNTLSIRVGEHEAKSRIEFVDRRRTRTPPLDLTHEEAKQFRTSRAAWRQF